jgi:hypothetical protein
MESFKETLVAEYDVNFNMMSTLIRLYLDT